mgnify:CR=1 FL=1|tara:strand:- start:731 stop:970 length:240 start_codon:yes stop_codon:yes gene_type:complete
MNWKRIFAIQTAEQKEVIEMRVRQIRLKNSPIASSHSGLDFGLLRGSLLNVMGCLSALFAIGSRDGVHGQIPLGGYSSL